MKTVEEMRAYKREWARAHFKPAAKKHAQALPSGMKVCGKCGALKPFERFARGKCADGYHAYCKPCNVAAFQDWYVENGDSFRTYVRDRRLADPEAYRRHTSKLLRMRRIEHPEAVRAADKRKRQRRRQKYPESFVVQRARRRARHLAAPGRGVRSKEWRAMLRESCGLCTYCAMPVARPQMDHVDALARGGAHDIDNIAVACARCNKSKGDRPLLVWLAWRAA